MQTNKILIILPHLVCGGTERTAAELANYLAEQGQAVTIVLMYKREVFYKLHQDVRLVQPEDFIKITGKALYIPFIIFFLRKHIKREKPQTVFAIGYILLTLISALGIKTRVVISGRSSPKRVRFPGNKLMNFFYNVAHSLLRNRVNGIIAQTESSGNVYNSRYSCPIAVIPNFLRDLSYNVNAPVNQIITVGRCSMDKGQHFLIKAFSIINANDWNLVIVGDGPEKGTLETLANDLGLKERVIFTGFQKDVDIYLSRSKIYVLSSIYEGFPNALIEAMATPLAPVSFNCDSGPSEIIQHGKNGYLVEVGNVDELSYYLSKLINDEVLRKSIAYEAYKARTLYSISTIGKKYMEFLQLS